MRIKNTKEHKNHVITNKQTIKKKKNVMNKQKLCNKH